MENEAAEELKGLAIREVLDADSRPTFILDLDPDEDLPAGTNRALLPVFCNAALRSHEILFDSLIGSDAHGIITTESGDNKPTYEDFKAWVTGVTPHDDSKDVFPLSFLYGDLLWTGSTVRQRWRLISGNRLWHAADIFRDLSSGAPLEVATGGARVEGARDARPRGGTSRKGDMAQMPPAAQPQLPVDKSTDGARTLVPSEQPRPEAPPSKPSYFPRPSEKSSDDTGGSGQTGSIPLSSPEKAVADWTVAKPKGMLSPFLQYARSVDWASSPLGPMNEWSPEFRQLANLCMVSCCMLIKSHVEAPADFV